MSQESMRSTQVFVEVLPTPDSGRQINWHDSMAAELFGQRGEDIRKAIAAGTKVVADGLEQPVIPNGWKVDEVTASFGIALTAEAGVIITRTSVGATLEVTVKFSREN